MKRRKGFGVKLGFVFLILLLALIHSWGYDYYPDLKSPFENVGADGVFFEQLDLDSLDCGEGIILPIRLKFSGQGGRKSKYLGSGWETSLLDANAVFVEDKVIRVLTPNGETIYLVQDRNDPKHYSSAGGTWKGELASNTMTIENRSGEKFIYSDGEISSMRTSSGRQIDWVKENGNITEIREISGKLLLQLRRYKDGLLSSIVVNDKVYELSYVKRPVITTTPQSLQVVSGFEQSLGKVSLGNQIIASYEYSVDKLLNPLLKVTRQDVGEQEFCWDPKSGYIVSDGMRNYIVNRLPGSIEITRTDDKSNKKQSVFYDYIKGVYRSVDGEGRASETNYFLSPEILRGKVRTIDISSAGQSFEVLKASYDDAGRPRRIKSPDGSFEYNYGDKDVVTSFQGIQLWTGDSDKFPQTVKDAIKLIGDWTVAHPFFLADTKVTGSMVKLDSTYLITPTLKRVLYSYTAPFHLDSVMFPSDEGGTLQYFVGSNTTVRVPESISGLSPEVTIWDLERLKAALKNEEMSIGLDTTQATPTIILSLNQSPPITAVYSLDATGQIQKATLVNGSGLKMTESYTFGALDEAEILKRIEGIKINLIVNKSLSWADALQREVNIKGGSE